MVKKSSSGRPAPSLTPPPHSSLTTFGRPPPHFARCRSPPKSIAPQDRKLWEFFCGILEHGRVTPEYQDHLLGTYMANFRASVTHISVTGDATTSLEYYEKYGDTVVNLCINWWIATTHPDLVSVHVGAGLLSAIKGTKYLGLIGEQHGWGDVMILDPEIIVRLKFLAGKTKDFTATKEHPEGYIGKMRDYVKIFEDAVEAFFGCLTMTMLDDGQSFGAAIEVANNIFFWMLNSTQFFGPDEPPGLDITKDLDPATTLRDLYQNKNELGWNFHAGVVTQKKDYYFDQETGQNVPVAFRYVIYHWDKADIGTTGDVMRDYTTNNRKLLYVSDWSFDEKEAKRKASKDVLKLLAEGKANVYEVKGNEYILKGTTKLSKKYVLQHPPDPTSSEKKWKGVYSTYISKFGPSGIKANPKRKMKKGVTYITDDGREENQPTTDFPGRSYYQEDRTERAERGERTERGGYRGGRGGYAGRGRGGFSRGGGTSTGFVSKKFLEE